MDEYEDLYLHFDGDDRQLLVRTGSDAYGQDAADSPLKFATDALPARIGELDKCLHRMFDPNTPDPKPWQRQLSKLQTDLGGDLFGILTEGDVGDHLHRLYGRRDASDHAKGLRIRIAWKPNNSHLNTIVAAPWELLHDCKTGDFLGRRSGFPISRYLSGLSAIRPLEISEPLKVLIVVSKPEGESGLDADREAEAIRKALSKLDHVEVHEAPPILLKIRDTIKNNNIHVLHFIGHGGFSDDLGMGWLVLADENNEPVEYPGDELADRLKDRPSLRLVVLSNCHGASMPRQDGQNAFWTVAPALVRLAEIPAVVAMQASISNDAAIAFSQRFYDRIAAYDTVDVAVAEARLALGDRSQLPETRLQWPLPVIFMRVEDGLLLARAAENGDKPSGLRSSGVPPQTREVRRIGIRSFADGYGEGLEDRADDFLGLDDLFEGRFIRDPEAWNGELIQRQEQFCSRFVVENRRLEIDFAALWSIAFTTGWFLEAKSGLDITILQRIHGGKTIYFSQEGPCPEGSLWSFEDHIVGTGTDLAVAISLTQNTWPEVETYLTEKGGPEIGRVIHAMPPGGPHRESVESGVHALRLAHQLDRRLQFRTLEERKGTLHLFCAAPNVFFLSFLDS